jgi:hypothetical protein
MYVGYPLSVEQHTVRHFNAEGEHSLARAVLIEGNGRRMRRRARVRNPKLLQHALNLPVFAIVAMERIKHNVNAAQNSLRVRRDAVEMPLAVPINKNVPRFVLLAIERTQYARSSFERDVIFVRWPAAQNADDDSHNCIIYRLCYGSVSRAEESGMNQAWLADRDAAFHKRQYRAYLAQLVFCNESKSLYAGLVKDRMERLLSFQKVSKEEATLMETEVRVELAETYMGLKD